MYTLTLTRAERQAIDHIGMRYWNGNSLYRILWVGSDAVPNHVDWDNECDITFHIPQTAAWDIRENWEFEGRTIPLFGEVLKGKVLSLIQSIVERSA